MKKLPLSIISILAGILLIFVAYQLDFWMYALRHSISAREFGVSSHAGWMACAFFSVFLMAGSLLIWLWFTQRHVQKHSGLSLIYVVVGAAMPIYSLLMISFNMSLNSTSFTVYFSIAPLSLASFASAVIACVGLQRLIFR